MRFVYNYDLHLLHRKVDFAVKDARLSDALDKLLENSGLRYRDMGNNMIVIVPRTEVTATGGRFRHRNGPAKPTAARRDRQCKGYCFRYYY
ncbi:STN domain-containing protein [Chitinophaga sedimenti]|uniref:STN domain-containing protein n=1 Tax=Chitinophaga sedimenti TaxID=2033606 RepID=UPI00355784A1